MNVNSQGNYYFFLFVGYSNIFCDPAIKITESDYLISNKSMRCEIPGIIFIIIAGAEFDAAVALSSVNAIINHGNQF